MKRLISVAIISLFNFASAHSQQPAKPSPRPSVQQRDAAGFDLSQYGVSFQSDPRLMIVMAALEAAGFDPTPQGAEPSAFRAQVRRDVSDLDPDLRGRLRSFYERNRLPAPATSADQAARYVSLAFALGPLPALDAPVRSDELPASLLEVLDFAPLVQEFYRRSHVNENLVAYTRAYQAEGDRLRRPTAEMVGAILSYLHTRPITVSVERVEVKPPTTQKKNAPKTYTTREHERRFVIVPDLLGAPGTINLRVIGDEYYVVLPEGTDPASSELRRAYLQYVIDPLMLRFNRDIAARREQIKQLLAEQAKSGRTISPDVFLTVSRSLVAAADARFDEIKKLESLSVVARATLANEKSEAARSAIAKKFQADTAAIKDETIARLAEEYERGAVLAFFFAEQLSGIETSGFDVANFFVDMISSFDPARETRRLAENAEARKRALAAREARLSARNVEVAPLVYTEAEAAKNALLVKKLGEIEQTLRLKDYVTAEARLKELVRDFPREPRIFFALAQTASIAAADATDEEVQAERLNRALGNYRLALEASSAETDRALISRAHEAMGRIYSFLEQPAAAEKEFDEAIKVGDVPGGAYKDAIEGKKKLVVPR
jgi:hypothetical protein